MTQKRSKLVSVFVPTIREPVVNSDCINYVVNAASKELKPHDIEFIFRIDTQDFTDMDHVKRWIAEVESAIAKPFRDMKIKVLLGPKLFGYCSNTDFFEEMHEKAEGEFYFFLNDDIHGVSQDWDVEIRKYCGKVCILKTANRFDDLDFPVVAAKWREVNGTFGYAPFLPYDMHSWDNYFPEIFITSNIRVDHTAIADVGNNSNMGMNCGLINHPEYKRSKHLQLDGTWADEHADFGKKEGEMRQTLRIYSIDVPRMKEWLRKNPEWQLKPEPWIETEYKMH